MRCIKCNYELYSNTSCRVACSHCGTRYQWDYGQSIWVEIVNVANDDYEKIAREALGKENKPEKGKCICAGLLNFEPDAVPNPDCPIHGAGFRWGKE